MTDILPKSDLFLRLGYGGSHDLLETALEEAGLSRPDKSGIAASKMEAVATALEERFLLVCSRGDCQLEGPELAAGRTIVSAARQDECAVCGGSANARAVDAMVEAMQAAGLSRLCVVGGSPNAHSELTRLVRDRVELRLIEGTVSRSRRQAQADCRWADKVALWGGTVLDHRVSRLYTGANVIQFARRSIQELAREVRRSSRDAGRG